MMPQNIRGPLSASDGQSKGPSTLKGEGNHPFSYHTLCSQDPDMDTDITEVFWDSDHGIYRCFEATDSDFSRSLPIEMSEQIFLLLDPQSLCSAAQTCRRWHYLIHNSEAVWRGQCLLLRAYCCHEVEQDRSHGLSWKVTLVKNYARNCLKRDWLRGRFSCVQSANELRDVRMVPLDAESWGEILQAELDR